MAARIRQEEIREVIFTKRCARCVVVAPLRGIGIDELTTKYKRGREIVNKERAGAEALRGDYVLQVPKQKNAIPQDVLDYAKEQDVLIEIVEDVTDAMLKWW